MKQKSLVDILQFNIHRGASGASAPGEKFEVPRMPRVLRVPKVGS
jgi:hypothetical protein